MNTEMVPCRKCGSPGEVVIRSSGNTRMVWGICTGAEHCCFYHTPMAIVVDKTPSTIPDNRIREVGIKLWNGEEDPLKPVREYSEYPTARTKPTRYWSWNGVVHPEGHSRNGEHYTLDGEPVPETATLATGEEISRYLRGGIHASR